MKNLYKHLIKLHFGLFIFFASKALAHHPLEGKLPSTLAEGLLSGLAHPIIGLDHLLFIISIALIAAWSAVRLSNLLLSFTIAVLAGITLISQELTLPSVETFIAVSVLLAGLYIIAKPDSQLMANLFSAGAGLFHGLAYGEAIYGAPVISMAAYVIAIGLIQCVIAGAVFWGSLKLSGNSQNFSKYVTHTSGGVIAILGTLMVSNLAI